MEDDSTVTPHLVMSQWVIYDHPRDFPDKYILGWATGTAMR